MFQFKKINETQKKIFKVIKVNKTGLCSWNWYFDGIINTFFSKQQVQTVFTNNFFIKILSFFQVKNITLNLLNIKKQYEKYFYRIKKNNFDYFDDYKKFISSISRVLLYLEFLNWQIFDITDLPNMYDTLLIYQNQFYLLEFYLDQISIFLFQLKSFNIDIRQLIIKPLLFFITTEYVE